MKRKLVISLLAITLLIGLVGCGNGADSSSAGTSVVEQKEDNLSIAKSAYSDLNKAVDMCSIMGEGIVGAWNWSIYKADESYGYYSDLSKVTGLTSDELKAATQTYHENFGVGKIGSPLGMYESVYFEDFNTTIQIVMIGYESGGYIDDVTKYLDSAKANITKVDSSEAYYNDLKSYYTAVSNLFEFVKSPSGNYQSAANSVSGYEEEIKTHKSNLSFDLE